MIERVLLLTGALAYLLLLSFIAYWVSTHPRSKLRQFFNGPNAYALTLGIYCTGWSFLAGAGSVYSFGILLLSIHLGVACMSFASLFVLRKLIRLCKEGGYASAVDLVAARYGNRRFIGAVLTLIVMVAMMPYTALQLEVIHYAFRELMAPSYSHWWDYLGLIMIASFALIYGMKTLDVTDHRPGIVSVVVVSSVVKLVAIITLGFWVVYGVFDGFSDLFSQASNHGLHDLWQVQEDQYGTWTLGFILGASTLWILPHQFHMAVVESQNEGHIRRASWLFPLYNFGFVILALPVGVAGKLLLESGENPDSVIPLLVRLSDSQWLSFIVFLGAFSAAGCAVVVGSIAINNILCNNVIIPSLLRWGKIRALPEKWTVDFLLFVRRAGLIAIGVLSLVLCVSIGTNFSIVMLGTTSFLALAQLAPGFWGALYWKEATVTA